MSEQLFPIPKYTDFSSLASYISCPRKYLFRHILNLRKSGPQLDITIGGAWHHGMAKGYELAKSEGFKQTDFIEVARLGFKQYWENHAGEMLSWDVDAFGPKHPTRMLDMYEPYLAKYKDDFGPSCQILAVEQPFFFAWPQDSDSHVNVSIAYTGKRDLVLRKNEFIVIPDHKTSKYDQPDWYRNSLQFEGYQASAHIMYPKQPIRAESRVCILQKAKTWFSTTDCTISFPGVERFIQELHTRLYRLETEYLTIQKLGHSADVLPAFLRSGDTACTQYFRLCEYNDLCHCYSNPLKSITQETEISGYVRETWDPLSHKEG